VLHLQSVRRNVNRNAGLICSHILSTQSQITVDRYRSGRIGIGVDMQTDISYSPIL